MKLSEAFHGDCTRDPEFDGDGVQSTSGLDARGREVPDPVPMAPPVGYQPGPNLRDLIQRMCRQELSTMAVDQGFETFEESEDFDIADDPLDPRTPYEAVFDPPPAPPSEVKNNASTGSAEPPKGGAGGNGVPPASAVPEPVSPPVVGPPLTSTHT